MGLTAGTTVGWCEKLLASLHDRVGGVGLAAAGTDAALSATVVRHAGEVRAWLSGQGLAVSRPSLAGYAAVLLAAAQRCDRRLPDPTQYDWADAEWFVVRLLAVCALASAAEPGRPLSPPGH